ncbi:hypothetical protein [Desulfovibrio sp. Huiquan2017]|uniref:hypothetical protein n=1 Tax=Desulfovibrio sp. Huiquan2017 TaxID=2816861 RepID=UPI001A922C89|nr:hypothetical protein [Desulfovibrio sp. Huiquan2017]
MSKKNFTYVNTVEDGKCPFCGGFVPQGVSVCESCHAVHGEKIEGAGSFLLLPVLGAALFAGGVVGVHFKNGFWGVVAGFAIFIPCAVGIMKFCTSKGWFR